MKNALDRLKLWPVVSHTVNEHPSLLTRVVDEVMGSQDLENHSVTLC